jgi:hypothetical protein
LNTLCTWSLDQKTGTIDAAIEVKPTVDGDWADPDWVVDEQHTYQRHEGYFQKLEEELTTGSRSWV